MALIFKQTEGWYNGAFGPYATKQMAIQQGAIDQKNQMDLKVIGWFIGSLLHSATITHLMHFNVTGEGSDAAHRALQAYYEEIPELVDSLTESIQGAYGVLINATRQVYADTNLVPLEYIASLQRFVKEQRKTMPQDSEIQNEIDSIANLLNSTAYRLKFLR
jgi:DNA-binding ferritin-like protein